VIVGIGVDITEVNRIERLYRKFGSRFYQRILTENEIDQFYLRQNHPHFLATRFAAKEAAAKALGTGFRQNIGFQCFEIQSDPSGQPKLMLQGSAKALAQQRLVSKTFLSISDEKQYAVAMVILEAAN